MRKSVSLEKSLKRGTIWNEGKMAKTNWSSFPISPDDLGFELGLQSQATHIKVLRTRRHKTKTKFQSFGQTLLLPFPWRSFSLLCPSPARASSAALCLPPRPSPAACCRLQSTYKQHPDKVRTSRDTIFIRKFFNQMGHGNSLKRNHLCYREYSVSSFTQSIIDLVAHVFVTEKLILPGVNHVWITRYSLYKYSCIIQIENVV